MNLIAWIVLGAIAGYLAGFLVRGDEGLGVIGHIVLGIVGALVGGFLASLLFNVKDPLQGALDVSTIVISIIGAVIVVLIASFGPAPAAWAAGPSDHPPGACRPALTPIPPPAVRRLTRAGQGGRWIFDVRRSPRRGTLVA